MLNIDFASPGLLPVCHPKYQKDTEPLVKELSARGLTDHFLILSSGTTGADVKGYALSAKALLTNAEAVNKHFSLTAEDVWGLSIPSFHVGGLSVLARAYLFKKEAINLGPWEPLEWVRQIDRFGVTITTVVPTQIFDLVHHKVTAPPSLKHLVVGGDFLSEELAKKARDLGWPVIRTFGMTEVGSQLASGKVPGGEMEILSIHQVKTSEGRLLVKTPSLFTLEFRMGKDLVLKEASELCDEDGFYMTQDLVEIRGKTLKSLGRIDDQIKISGRLYPATDLREKLYTFTLIENLYGKVEMLIEDDERSGKKIVLLHLPSALTTHQKAALKELFAPIHTDLIETEHFGRTDLGKLKKRT